MLFRNVGSFALILVWFEFCRLNEEMIETLFGCDSMKEMGSVRRKVVMSTMQGNHVLDPKKLQNVAILLRALNVTKEEVCEALLEGDFLSLGCYGSMKMLILRYYTICSSFI